MGEVIWGPNEGHALFSSTLPNIAAAGIALNLVALFCFFAFKKQRKFPPNLLAWLVISNLCYDIWLLAKWTGNTSIKMQTSLGLCNLAIFMDAHHYINTSCLSLLMCITLYLSLSRNKDLEFDTNPVYLWSFVAFIALFPPAISLLVTYSGKHAGNVNAGYNCFPQNQNVQYFYTAVILFIILLQLILLVHALTSLGKIIGATKGTLRPSQNSKKDIRMFYMTFRFAMSFIVQLVSVLPYVYVIIFPLKPPFNPDELRLIVATYAVTTFADALILLFGNQNLLRFLARRIGYVWSSAGDDGTTSTSVNLTETTQSNSVTTSL